MVLAISNTVSFKFKSIFKLNKKSIKHHLDERTNCQNDLLSYLPEEILLNVFANLDSPTEFICTSRYFASLGSSPRFIAHWITLRYGMSCALYCALTKHSEICDDKLVRCLMTLQVDMPRYLLQMLIENYRGPRRASVKSSSSSNQSGGKLSAFTDDISALPFSGYAAVINAAFEKYGDIFTSEENDYSTVIRILGELQNGHGSEEKQAQLEQIFFEKQFSPVPMPEQMMPKYLVRLALEDTRLFNRISPVFRIDKHARYRVWEWALVDAIDNSFSSSDKLSARKMKLMESTSMCLKEMPVGGIKEEREVFILAMVSVFKRYPSGYISASVIAKAFHLVDKYIKPDLADMMVKDEIETKQDISPVILEGFEKFISTRAKK
ncbi:hypothetical protein INT44_007831 [Umbelopsis vinacea]|uniref:F-box domain-containing protein n=1 Tax=Umbelopsis vinacea TaxID=44442 RepID=A0A8H7UCY6_9FUNG|nr:hypothetical protein INT44_007831 [Umbelopsis vinacea]